MEVGGELVEPTTVVNPRVSDDTLNSSQDVDGTSTIPACLTPEELVAKAIAPVKKEFLCPPPVRADSTSASNQNEGVHEHKSAPLLKEKKSKRQLKRERRQVFFLHQYALKNSCLFSFLLSNPSCSLSVGVKIRGAFVPRSREEWESEFLCLW